MELELNFVLFKGIESFIIVSNYNEGTDKNIITEKSHNTYELHINTLE